MDGISSRGNDQHNQTTSEKSKHTQKMKEENTSDTENRNGSQVQSVSCDQGSAPQFTDVVFPYQSEIGITDVSTDRSGDVQTVLGVQVNEKIVENPGEVEHGIELAAPESQTASCPPGESEQQPTENVVDSELKTAVSFPAGANEISGGLQLNSYSEATNSDPQVAEKPIEFMLNQEPAYFKLDNKFDESLIGSATGNSHESADFSRDDDDDDFGDFGSFSGVEPAVSNVTNGDSNADEDFGHFDQQVFAKFDEASHELSVEPVSRSVFQQLIEQLFNENLDDCDQINGIDKLDPESFQTSVRRDLDRCENIDEWECVVFRYENSRTRKILLSSLCIDETPANCPRFAIDCLNKDFLQPVKESTAAKSAEELTEQAKEVLNKIPDLSFMKAEVLTFPASAQAT